MIRKYIIRGFILFITTIFLVSCNENNGEKKKLFYIQNAVLTDSSSLANGQKNDKNLTPDNSGRSHDLKKWFGAYLSSKKWSKDDYNNQKEDGSKFGFHKLIIKQDSVFFSLDLEGFTLVSYPEYSYQCSVKDINDTLYITFNKFIDGYFDRFPASKPILKFYKSNNNKYFAVNNNFDALDLKEEDVDTEEFYKSN